LGYWPRKKTQFSFLWGTFPKNWRKPFPSSIFPIGRPNFPSFIQKVKGLFWDWKGGWLNPGISANFYPGGRGKENPISPLRGKGDFSRDSTFEFLPLSWITTLNFILRKVGLLGTLKAKF